MKVENYKFNEETYKYLKNKRNTTSMDTDLLHFFQMAKSGHLSIGGIPDLNFNVEDLKFEIMYIQSEYNPIIDYANVDSAVKNEIMDVKVKEIKLRLKHLKIRLNWLCKITNFILDNKDKTTDEIKEMFNFVN